MPIHDWTPVPAGTYHLFHQRRISALADVLDSGGLPEVYFAKSEADAKGPIPDLLASRGSRQCPRTVRQGSP
jgi:hypothetical protein